MREELKGKVIRVHGIDGYVDFGRIIHDCLDCDDVFYIPYPIVRKEGGEERRLVVTSNISTQKDRRKPPHLCMPRRLPRALISQLGDGHPVSLVDFLPPPEWQLRDDDLKLETKSLDRNRKNLPKWLHHREQQKFLIAPIVAEFGEYELLELGLLTEVIQARARDLGHSTTKKVRQVMLRYLLGCGHVNALLPAWSAVGGRGTEKYSGRKVGRPSRKSIRPGAHAEYVICEDDRRKLRDGYEKYKKKRVPVHQAYLLTCQEYWPGGVAISNRSQRKYFLLPAHQRPTEAQFKWAVKSLCPASRINLGERLHRMTKRALMGQGSDGVFAVGQLGLIDSTSEDQTLVSSANLLKVLPTTYRTIIADVRTEYILGLYCGFEHPSTLTSLLAILNSARDKVAFCAKYGVQIEKGEWHSRLCRRLRSDHGELKSEMGISTMTATEVGLEFVRSYAGDMKGMIEAKHLSMHRRVDHLAAGSTQGRAKERGEPSREDEACRTFETNMQFVLETVLYLNNEEPVPHLLSVEMRNSGVQPTRRAIYEWHLDKGYVSTEPTDLDTLVVHCLPKLNGVIRRDGIHVYDPRDERNLIPGLIYVSQWLGDSGLCGRGRVKSVKCEIQLDPSNVSVAYLIRNGLHELNLKTTDALLKELTLLEFLLMTDDDKEEVDAMRSDLESTNAHFYYNNRMANQSAKTAKKAALQASDQHSGGALVSNTGHNKHSNRHDELSRQRIKRLGLHESNGPPPLPGIAVQEIATPVQTEQNERQGSVLDVSSIEAAQCQSLKPQLQQPSADSRYADAEPQGLRVSTNEAPDKGPAQSVTVGLMAQLRRMRG